MAASTNRSFEYLEQLPGLTFQKLYQQPSTALAIFRRMLPDLGALIEPYFVSEFLVLINGQQNVL
jgi:transcription initiation factor TFIIH subunit 4